MTDLNELFSRDPLKYTKDDISVIIAKMRESRAQFNLGNMKAGTMKAKAPAAPKTAAGKAAASLNLKLDLSSLVKK